MHWLQWLCLGFTRGLAAWSGYGTVAAGLSRTGKWGGEGSGVGVGLSQKTNEMTVGQADVGGVTGADQGGRTHKVLGLRYTCCVPLLLEFWTL